LRKKCRIEYSKHAEEQLKERNIKKTMVRETLLKPQQVFPGGKGRKVAHRIYTIADRDFLHRVVFVEHRDYNHLSDDKDRKILEA